jgi:hypothetical protein
MLEPFWKVNPLNAHNVCNLEPNDVRRPRRQACDFFLFRQAYAEDITGCTNYDAVD